MIHQQAVGIANLKATRMSQDVSTLRRVIIFELGLFVCLLHFSLD